MRRPALLWGLFALVGVLLYLWHTVPPQPTTAAPSSRAAIVGDPDVLRQKYEDWKLQLPEGEIGHSYTMGLYWSKGLSVEHTEAFGSVEIDVVEQVVSAEIRGLEQDRALDLWLIDNSVGTETSVLPEEGDGMLRVGTFSFEDGRATLVADVALDEDFRIDLVVASIQGEDPGESGLLFGTPTLFQRLYAQESRDELEAERRARSSAATAAVLAIAAPVPPSAPEQTGMDIFDSLVAEGEVLFFTEEFAGNTRTCGTCHPAGNNLTIDPAFIDGLPDKDPLFVAEFIPALNFEKNGGRRFENPVLMRGFGLIVENLDGFGNLAKRFTMRGVPHVFSQALSIQTPEGGIMPPNDRTGWSGDGAPSGPVGNLMTFGTLRDFPVGAVVQHFPLTLAREPGEDFELPTPSQLDALEAFMLSLGRQEELELRNADSFGNPLNPIVLADSDAEAGKVLFRDGIPNSTPPFFTCQNCHANAGANVIVPDEEAMKERLENQNFNTGIELFLINHPDGTGELRPIDGGFGRAPDGSFPEEPEPNGDGSFGDMTFNTPSLIEFADTLPAFHNNVITDLEESILFYQSDEFEMTFPPPNGGFSIPFDEVQVFQVAQFLRVINVLDNLENSALRFAQRALHELQQSAFDSEVVNRLLRLAIEDVDDSFDVLKDGNLHPDARGKLRQARGKFRAAMAPSPPSVRIQRVQEGMASIQEALAIMVL